MARIDLCNISVEFPVYHIHARSFKKNFLRVATGGAISKNANDHIMIRSLNAISLTIHHGDRVGLIGCNGAGKSTLLRLLAGIYEPTHGNLRVQGRVSALLDLMQGIEAEFTGLENIQLRGTILGLTQKEMKKRLEEITNFTGLGDYLSMPVRTYSSGMKVRLAFAISTSIMPEILLIDEVFGAGDADFREKARNKMISLLNQSSIVVIATHVNEIIREFCNKALLLENGRIKYFGSVEEGLKLYQRKK